MSITQLDTENGDYDLTSQQTVLTDTPDASVAKLCRAVVLVGDGSKDLDGTGGDFELEITIGGNSVQPGPQTITLGAIRHAGGVCVGGVSGTGECASVAEGKEPKRGGYGRGRYGVSVRCRGGDG